MHQIPELAILSRPGAHVAGDEERFWLIAEHILLGELIDVRGETVGDIARSEQFTPRLVRSDQCLQTSLDTTAIAVIITAIGVIITAIPAIIAIITSLVRRRFHP